jgi:hypothetical protein
MPTKETAEPTFNIQRLTPEEQAVIANLLAQPTEAYKTNQEHFLETIKAAHTTGDLAYVLKRMLVWDKTRQGMAFWNAFYQHLINKA